MTRRSGSLARLALNRLVQIPVGLQPRPELRRPLEQAPNAQRRAGRHDASAGHDLVEAVERNSEAASGFDLPKPEGFQRINRCKSLSRATVQIARADLARTYK